MGTCIYIAAHPTKQRFEIGGSWAEGFPEEALLTKETIFAEFRKRLSTRSDAYLQRLSERVFAFVEQAEFNVSVWQDQYGPTGSDEEYKLVQSYFPLE